MDERWLFLQAFASCILGVCCSKSLLGEKCNALINDPDSFNVCAIYNSGISLKFSGKDSPKKPCGSFLPPNEAGEVPFIRWPRAVRDNYYTILMVDPDAPNQQSHQMRYWIHWMVTGVSGNALANEKSISGQEPISYQGPNPAAKSGPHRYQIFIFKSPQGTSLSGIPEGNNVRKRAKFSLNAFIALNQFCDSLVAAYQFTSTKN